MSCCGLWRASPGISSPAVLPSCIVVSRNLKQCVLGMVRLVDLIFELGERTDLLYCCNASSRSHSPEMRPPSWPSRRGRRELHHSGERQRYSATTIHNHGTLSAHTAVAKMLQYKISKGQRLDKKINHKAKIMQNKLFQCPVFALLGNL